MKKRLVCLLLLTLMVLEIFSGTAMAVTQTGSVSTACLAKIVMPRARSWLSVSRKASLWSTRPSLRSTPAR